MYETDCADPANELTFTDKCKKAAFWLSAFIVAIAVGSTIMIVAFSHGCKLQ